MKKILCYLGIIILFCLVIFPPVLRLTLPDKIKEEKKDEKSNYILSCSNSRFIINTSYENKIIKMIIIKMKYTEQEIDKRKQLDESIGNIDNQLLDSNTNGEKYQDIIDIFQNIKDKTTVTHETIEDGEIILIDYSVNDHKELKIDKISQEIEEQQKYYEKIGFSCTVK